MDIHPPFLTFLLKITRVDGIYYIIIIILELDPSILLQELGFDFLITFLGGIGHQIFFNVGTEFPHRRRLPISRKLIGRVTKVFFKIIPIIYGLPLVTPFRDLGLVVDN